MTTIQLRIELQFPGSRKLIYLQYKIDNISKFKINNKSNYLKGKNLKICKNNPHNVIAKWGNIRLYSEVRIYRKETHWEGESGGRT